MSAFKAYDIRGVVGRDWDAGTAYAIGRWLPIILNARKFLVGRDARLTSPSLRDALCRGLVEAGCQVDDLGPATTPMVYFFTARDGYDASVQITASHNPPEYNGMKISRRGAVPVGYATGLGELEQRLATGDLPPPAAQPGEIRSIDRRDAFTAWLRRRRPDLDDLRFAVDCSDGMASLVVHDLFGDQAIYLNDTPDGRFPHHPPNPLDPENCRQLADCVRHEKLDLGVIFDGDADRVMFVDETGRFIQPDFLIPLIAEDLLIREPGAVILHDIRTSRGVIEALHRMGAQPFIWKVGHAHAKLKLRELDAIFGGELAGHYYFRDFFCCDSGELAALAVLGAAARAKQAGRTFSSLIAPIAIYANSGELNYIVEDKDAAIRAVEEDLQSEGVPQMRHDFDGIRLEWSTWWINLRKSNTEPYLRLVLEARTADLLTAKRRRIETVLAPFITPPEP